MDYLAQVVDLLSAREKEEINPRIEVTIQKKTFREEIHTQYEPIKIEDDKVEFSDTQKEPNLMEGKVIQIDL